MDLFVGEPKISGKAFSATGSSYEGPSIDETLVPRATAGSLLRFPSAEEGFRLIGGDDKAALPRLELDPGHSGSRGWLSDLRHGSDVRSKDQRATR